MQQNTTKKGPGRHRWEDNKCVRCGLQRKGTALSPDGRAMYRDYFYKYLVNGVWIDERPLCITAKTDKDE